MNEEMIGLSHRAVACPRWRWMPGMKVGNDRIMDESETREVRSDELPDLTDPATLGCLLALVREAWGDPYLCCVGDRETGWRLDGYAAVEDIHSYRSEAEALFVALRAAP